METLQYTKETKSRKIHTCNFCLNAIPQGLKYLKSTHVYDGQIYDWKSHLDCYWIAIKLKMHRESDEGVTTDAFQEFIHEEHDSILYQNLPKDWQKENPEIMAQFTKVSFDRKLPFVIRWHKKFLTQKP